VGRWVELGDHGWPGCPSLAYHRRAERPSIGESKDVSGLSRSQSGGQSPKIGNRGRQVIVPGFGGFRPEIGYGRNCWRAEPSQSKPRHAGPRQEEGQECPTYLIKLKLKLYTNTLSLVHHQMFSLTGSLIVNNGKDSVSCSTVDACRVQLCFR